MTWPRSLKMRKKENAILIARTDISCLDDLSIEGDIPEDVSDIKYEIDSS